MLFLSRRVIHGKIGEIGVTPSTPMTNIYPLRLYLKHKPNSILLAIIAACNLFLWVWLLWYIPPQEELIFLHYTTLFGVDLLGEWYKVFMIPVMGICIAVVHGLLGWFFFSKDKYISYVLLAAACVVHIFLGITAVLLVFLNV